MVQLMDCQVIAYEPSSIRAEQLSHLLERVFVGEGYTDPAVALKAFQPDALAQRGDVLVAISKAGDAVGLIVCAPPTSSARQIAAQNEAEMHLLAVHPAARGCGIGSHLVSAFEKRASTLGYSRLVLSTQATMTSAHRLYERHGYRRNSSRDWMKSGKQYLVYEKAIADSAIL